LGAGIGLAVLLGDDGRFGRYTFSGRALRRTMLAGIGAAGFR
jgi:hypothetical protein